MPRRGLCIAVLGLTLAVGAARPAGGATDAAESPAPEGDEVLVSADRLERRADERVIVGEGAVVVRHREIRLAADRVVYHEQSKDLLADGNIVLDSGPDRLQGEHLELNLDTRVGFLERAQGFVQNYYFTGARIEKRGPDRYFIRGGTFTTCEGTLPDWSFHATSTELTIDEYLHAWNPTLQIKRLPVLYLPYAVFPVKRDRSTGLLIPEIGVTGPDGFVLRNDFYWAPRDNFDATIGLDYLAKTGWGASGEVRYLLSPRTQGILQSYYLREPDAERWAFSTRNSQELPLGIHAEIEAFFQSDRQFIADRGTSIEQRSNERTTSSFYLDRRWASWDFALSGRYEVSLLTESSSTLTRFPELTVARPSARILDTDLFLKVSAGAAALKREETGTAVETTRLHLAPELTWPVSLGSVARVIPTAGYTLTSYSENLAGEPETRSLPYYRLALEGPRPYRIWDLPGEGRFDKLKHLIEPRFSYVYTPEVDQDNLPQFDAVDYIPAANRLEYSFTNILYAKVRASGAAPAAPAPEGAVVLPTPAPEGATAAPVAAPRFTTRELLWIKLSQTYALDESLSAVPHHRFSPVEWDARSKLRSELEVSWRGNLDVYGDGIGYQNILLSWKPFPALAVATDWRTAQGSAQDFIDLGATLDLGEVNLSGRSRYNLSEDTFLENRINVKYTSQCWDIAVSYVRWQDDFQFAVQLSLKGIGTVLKL